MPIKIEMPRLSDTMQAGTVVKWNVKEGQKVKSGDVIADIETDKATMELPTYEDGVVALIATPEGQNVPIGTVIMVLAAPGEDVNAVKAAGAGAGSVGGAKAPAKAAASGGATTSATAVIEAAPATNGTHGGGEVGGGRIFVSPLARKIAEESGLNLQSIRGSGPSGRIVRKDVEEALRSGAAPATSAPARAAAPQPTVQMAPQMSPSLSPLGASLQGKVMPLSNMRRTIARRLVESKTTIPHYQVTVEVDMDALLSLRSQLNEQLGAQGVKLSVNDFLVRACALAMHQHPYVNARWVPTPNQEAIEFLPSVNVGVAIALPVNSDGSGGGLVVATLRNADQIGLRQISSQTKALADKARGKGLSVEDMSDATFTISNLGMFGVDHFTAIINPPNAAILAVGAALQKPVVRNGQIVVGQVMSMTLSSDHRIIDGAMAAQYLQTVKGLLEKPATLLV
ncbi:MAG: dihydrolipoamide acetyltransferase family protein [Planctomycetota bacterium]|nr:dihydrolipoamide acetyltransferase family protein [Planctomycetota bacterium]